MDPRTEGCWLDHVVVGIADLDAGMAEFEALTGVRPERGGEHPTLGTHNALVSLGDRQYLEILAPRPGAAVSPMFAAAADCPALRPILWAVATSDIAAVHRRLTDIGSSAPDPSEGSRKTAPTDGSPPQLLRWSMFMLAGNAAYGAPFFMQWDPSTRHPALDTPPGCSIATFSIASDDPDRLSQLLRAAGMETGPGIVEVQTEPGRVLELHLDTPRGPVVLGGDEP